MTLLTGTGETPFVYALVRGDCDTIRALWSRAQLLLRPLRFPRLTAQFLADEAANSARTGLTRRVGSTPAAFAFWHFLCTGEERHLQALITVLDLSHWDLGLLPFRRACLVLHTQNNHLVEHTNERIDGLIDRHLPRVLALVPAPALVELAPDFLMPHPPPPPKEEDEEDDGCYELRMQRYNHLHHIQFNFVKYERGRLWMHLLACIPTLRRPLTARWLLETQLSAEAARAACMMQMWASIHMMEVPLADRVHDFHFYLRHLVDHAGVCGGWLDRALGMDWPAGNTLLHHLATLFVPMRARDLTSTHAREAYRALIDAGANPWRTNAAGATAMAHLAGSRQHALRLCLHTVDDADEGEVERATTAYAGYFEGCMDEVCRGAEGHGLALAMALHPRLGAGSWLSRLEPSMVRDLFWSAALGSSYC